MQDAGSRIARPFLPIWQGALGDKSGATFAEVVAPRVRLEGSIYATAIDGRENVWTSMRTAAGITSMLNFTHESAAPDRVYLEWEQEALGQRFSGVTVLTFGGSGLIENVALHHRPLGAALAFSAEMGRRLGSSVGPGAFYQAPETADGWADRDRTRSRDLAAGGDPRDRHLPAPGSEATSMGKLQGKTAVITGATAGIGLAVARRFATEGAFVFITGRRQKELDDAVKEIGDNACGVQGDAASLADLDRLYETVGARGRIDVLVANAGVAGFTPLEAVTEEYFDRIFSTNVKGALFTAQKALPLLNDGGSIILTGSVASAKGTPAFAVYGASKAAIRNFARGWTAELKDRRIRVNVLSPGPIATSLTAAQPQDAIDKINSTIPMGRMGEPDEVAKAALFLASDDSSFVTGIELFVDGGRAQV